MPNFELKYENSENTKADRVNTVVFNLHQIKCRAFLWDTRYIMIKGYVNNFVSLKVALKILH